MVSSRKAAKVQMNSVSGGLMLMMVSGIHIAYGIFDIDIKTMHNQFIVKSSWYVGVILAGFAAHFLIEKLEKKHFYYIGTLICAVGSGIFINAMSPNYDEYAILGRFIAGFGHGFVYMPLVIHCGENASKKLRGKLLSSINFWITMSVSIFNITMITIEAKGSGDQKLFIVIFGILFSVCALIFIPCLCYESPVFLIRKNRENEALDNLIKLRNEQPASLELRREFEDLKQMIQEDSQTSSNIFKDNNLRPLLLVTLSKMLYSMSFICLLNIFRLTYAISGSFYSSNLNPFSIAFGILFFRTLIAIIPLFGMDRVGRKFINTVSVGLSGISILLFGIVLVSSDSLDLNTLIMFYILFDVFSSLGMGMVPDVLSSEAFPLNKKSLSITFTNTIDMLFNLILIAITPYVRGEAFNVILLVFGVLLILSAIVFYLKVPETKKMSLRHSRDILRERSIPVGI